MRLLKTAVSVVFVLLLIVGCAKKGPPLEAYLIPREADSHQYGIRFAGGPELCGLGIQVGAYTVLQPKARKGEKTPAPLKVQLRMSLRPADDYILVIKEAREVVLRALISNPCSRKDLQIGIAYQLKNQETGRFEPVRKMIKGNFTGELVTVEKAFWAGEKIHVRNATIIVSLGERQCHLLPKINFKTVKFLIRKGEFDQFKEGR